MNLSERLIANIAQLFGIDDISQITIQGNSVSIAGNDLSCENVLFNERLGGSQSSLSDYLAEYNVGPELSISHITDVTLGFNVQKLRLINGEIRHGFYTLESSEGSPKGVVFTGLCSGSLEEPNLTMFPEVIFALCILEPCGVLEEVKGWAPIFEALGPFAVLCKEELPICPLAECGIFGSESNPFSFHWDNELPRTIQTPNRETPPEAEAAYVAALANSNTPGIAFTQLYRVLEIYFAIGLRERIKNSDIREVLKEMKRFKDLSELTMLSTLLAPIPVPFSKFTATDFRKLYGTHTPTSSNYAPIKDWLAKTPMTIPSGNLRALLIYYVRCSLVHSKLGETEPFLMEPYTIDQVESLSRIIEDMRTIIQHLLY